jgi:hypothetical protein
MNQTVRQHSVAENVASGADHKVLGRKQLAQHLAGTERYRAGGRAGQGRAA